MNTVKKLIVTIFLCLLVASLLYGCSERQEQPNEQTYGEGATDSIPDSTSTELQTINPFEGVTFMFSGWDGYGELTVQTGECSQIIKDNIDFRLEGCINGELSNGAIVTIRAMYDSERIKNQNYSIEFDTMSVEISGLTELVSASNYSEDKAWIQYMKDEDSFLACIDKSGKILFQFNDGLDLQANLFSNGYAHITKNDGTMYVIDTDGTVKSKYSLDTTGEALAFGDGYTFTKKYVSNFDEAYDLFRIYDSDGVVIEEFKLPAELRSVYYCGEGVFELDIRRFNVSTWFYFAESDTWRYDTQAMLNCRFDAGLAFADLQSAEWDGNVPQGKLLFLENTGGIKEIELPGIAYFDWQWFQECYIKDEACILWDDSEPYVVTCDIGTGEFSFLDEYYLKKVDWDALKQDMGYVNGHVAIPLKGSDKKTYICLFDKALKPLIDPMEYGEIIGFSEDRLILRQSSGVNIYDGLGNLTFSLSEKNLDSISPYCNGVAHTEHFNYIDLNGDILFDNITTDGVEVVALDDIM